MNIFLQHIDKNIQQDCTNVEDIEGLSGLTNATVESLRLLHNYEY